MSVFVEVCCEALVENVRDAFQGGAARVELCAALKDGGTTPSIGALTCIMREVKAKGWRGEVHVMIRPRGGDFVYSSSEVDIMIADIKQAKECGVNGVVLGCLRRDGKVNVKSLTRLMEAAKPDLEVTFHRAFDMCADMFDALEILIRVSVDRVLTSGGARNATIGSGAIRELVARASGRRVVIAIGAGLNRENVRSIITSTGATHVHACSACMKTVDSDMQYRKSDVEMGPDSSEYARRCVCATRVRDFVRTAQGAITASKIDGTSEIPECAGPGPSS